MNKKLSKKSLVILWSILLFSLHLLFLFSDLRYSYVSGDIMRKTEQGILAFLLPAVSVLIIYLRFGVALNGFYSEEKSKIFVMISAFSLVFSRVCELITYTQTYADFGSNLAPFLINEALSLLVDFIVLFLLYFITVESAKKDKKIIFVFVITSLIMLVVNLANEGYYLYKFLSDINSEYGSMALSAEEIKSIVFSFIKPIIYSVCGFFIMLLCDKFINKQKNA